ncbi:MAG: UDP-N-acetylglucosamine 2-epimerase [Bacteroidota bacterium]
MKTICVVTGTRAEYGLLKRIMSLIDASEQLTLRTVVTGMHLSPEYGATAAEIEHDGFRIDARVDMLFSCDKASAMAKGVGVGVYGMAQAFESLAPDIVVVLGDRVEAFAAAIAASLSNIILAHIHGGDKSRGGLDETMRHAITKLAHLHFAATTQSAQRILQMGEEPGRVFVVGAPGLDEIFDTAAAGNPEELAVSLGLDLHRTVIVVVQHPVSTSPETAEQQIRETMEAIRRLAIQTVVICPNSDAGGRAMRATIDAYRDLPFVRVVKTLDRRQYLCLLRHSGVLVGNSSSGMIEAPCLGTPVVNIGERQEGREQAGLVLQAGYDRSDITAKIRQALAARTKSASQGERNDVYGDGKASARIVAHLERLRIDDIPRQKLITYS